MPGYSLEHAEADWLLRTAAGEAARFYIRAHKTALGAISLDLRALKTLGRDFGWPSSAVERVIRNLRTDDGADVFLMLCAFAANIERPPRTAKEWGAFLAGMLGTRRGRKPKDHGPVADARAFRAELAPVRALLKAWRGHAATLRSAERDLVAFLDENSPALSADLQHFGLLRRWLEAAKTPSLTGMAIDYTLAVHPGCFKPTTLRRRMNTRSQ